MAMNAMTAGSPASLNLRCVELKTGNQVSGEIKCYLDRVFKPMIKNWYSILLIKILRNKTMINLDLN